MLYRDICKTLSFYLWILLIPFCFPLAIGLYCEFIASQGAYPQPPSSPAFFAAMIFTFLLGLLFRAIGKKSSGHLYRKEALLLVLLVYFLTPVIWAMPFYLSKTLSNPVDAYFEAVSGLTTTGASVLTAKKYNEEQQEIPITKTFTTGAKTSYQYFGTITPVIDQRTGKELTGLEAVSPALIFWRSLMQWMGGGGIVVLFVAILPALGVGGKVLFQTEMTGPTKEVVMPKIKETASQLWKVYVVLTVIEIFLLKLTNENIPLFDAIAISLSTVCTGGFAPTDAGIAGYNSAYTDWVIIIFMILGSISFTLYFLCMRGKFFRLKDPELRAFLMIILVAGIIATWQLTGHLRDPLSSIQSSSESYSFFDAVRYGFFQVISAQTSTGFSTSNYDLWPFSVQVLMLVLMYFGGMAGSTAGGLKVIRHQTFVHIMLNKIESIYRPDTVRTFRVGNAVVDNVTATTILCFIMVAASLAIIGTFVLVLSGIDPETSLATISCMLNNVGMSFRMAGPTESFAFLPSPDKLLCALWMIAGRLEYFAVLIVFVPAFWRRT